jgi:hypothetical protein
MAGITADDGVRLGPAAKNLGRRRAAGIYGAIITAAIFDTAGGHLPTTALVVTVVVTLLVYWLAEEYAELLGEQAEGGRLPSWASIRGALAATWPMVSASYAPLLALLPTLSRPLVDHVEHSMVRNLKELRPGHVAGGWPRSAAAGA